MRRDAGVAGSPGRDHDRPGPPRTMVGLDQPAVTGPTQPGDVHAAPHGRVDRLPVPLEPCRDLGGGHVARRDRGPS